MHYISVNPIKPYIVKALIFDCTLINWRASSRQLNVSSGSFRPRPEEGHSPPVLLQTQTPPRSFMATYDFCKDKTTIWFLCVSKLYKSGQLWGFHWTPKNQKYISSPYPRYRLVLPCSPWGRPPRYCVLETPLNVSHIFRYNDVHERITGVVQ